MRSRSWLRLWLTFEERVGRREYLASGLALAAVKYAGDVLLVWSATGRVWAPLDYLRPVGALTAAKLAGAPPSLLPVLALWALPFLWIGVSMSMRRALDAGRSAWLALLFFVPGVNYAFIGLMSALPTRVPSAWERKLQAPPRPQDRRLPGALLAIAAGAAVGLGMIALSVYGLSTYGASLFLGTPFVMGELTAFLLNRRYPATLRETLEAAFMALGITGGVTLVTSLEGGMCLLMALPLALLITAMGAGLGRRIALHDRGPAADALLSLAVLPLSLALEADRPPTALREVRSSVEVDAPPDVVWRNVVAFPPLPEPTDVVFRTGIAYPKSAEIVGSGVGAVRRCVFSTGAFVEPITRWEPGRRLSFDVASQPRPLHEWSPFADVAPPHLDGYFRSRRGEFRLTPLPGGRTRLEGSTWYEMRLYPEAYWVLYGDALIGRIHGRVLAHVKGVAEREASRRSRI